MPRPPSPKTNGAAIASLIFGVIAGVPFSVAFGLFALRRIAQRGEGGRGLAIAGLSISAAWVTLLVAVSVLTAGDRTAITATPAIKPAPTVRTGSTSGPGRRYIGDLTLGDCLGYVDENPRPEGYTVKLCSQRHGGEVYDIWSPPSGAYPGDAEMDRLAGDHCGRTLDRYAVGKFADAKGVYLYPKRNSWSHDPRVFCIAVPGTDQWTGSMVHP